ncbi:hypothetical protein ABMY47_19960 [Pseudoalteromonas sp. BZP1]|uniref:hypothetical protein n=1 Tax=unclassified Pseudoalteromonas TaxID=194690 RepID=UPI0032C4A41C
MTLDTNYPDIDSDIYKQAETRVRKAIRLLLKEGHPFEPSKLLRRQEVQYAQRDCQIPQDLLDMIVFPLMDIRDWIWDEYAERKLWTVPEAACLGVGMDPLCYHLEPGQYYNGWREERETLLDAIKDAVLLEELVIIEKDGEQYIRPQDFCKWAYSQGLLTHDLAGPLRALAAKPATKDYIPDLDEMKARYVSNAQQRLFAEGLSHAERRRRDLFGLAIYAKYDDPTLTREAIAKLACELLNEDCLKLPGFGFSTVRNDLYRLDEELQHPDHATLRFFNSVPSEQEIMSTNPTHRWWPRWRSVIARKLPYLVLPE